MTEADLIDDSPLTPEKRAWFKLETRRLMLLLGSMHILESLKLPEPKTDKKPIIKARRCVRLGQKQVDDLKAIIRPLVEAKLPQREILDAIEDAGLDICKRTGLTVSQAKQYDLIVQVKRETGNFYTTIDALGQQIYELRENGMLNKDVAQLLGINPATASTTYRRYKFGLQQEQKR